MSTGHNHQAVPTIFAIVLTIALLVMAWVFA